MIVLQKHIDEILNDSYNVSKVNIIDFKHRILIVGDFNLGQMLPEHVAKVDYLTESFNLSQRSLNSTHILHRGILDLIFDTLNCKTASPLPSPYSDYLFLFFQI